MPMAYLGFLLTTKQPRSQDGLEGGVQYYAIKTPAHSTDIRKLNTCLYWSLTQKRLLCQTLRAMSVETQAVNYFRI